MKQEHKDAREGNRLDGHRREVRKRGGKWGSGGINPNHSFYLFAVPTARQRSSCLFFFFFFFLCRFKEIAEEKALGRGIAGVIGMAETIPNVLISFVVKDVLKVIIKVIVKVKHPTPSEVVIVAARKQTFR